MPPYDIVAGLDNPTLDRMLAMFYEAVYPNLLKGRIEVGAVGISSVDFDIHAAPTARLAPSAAARAHVERLIAARTAGLEALADAPPATRTATVDAATGASFDLTAPQMRLTVTYSAGPPTVVDTALSAAAVVTTGTDPSGRNHLTLHIVTATVSIPGNPSVEEVLNQWVMPLMASYLDSTVLAPFTIPALQYGPLTLSMPAPTVQEGYLLAFSALGTTQPDIPGPHAWPQQAVFLGSDPAALVAAANVLFPIGPSRTFDWEIISGMVGATVGPVGPGGVSVNRDGSLSAQLPCQAEAQLTVHTPWPLPDFTFGPSATATVSATATPQVVGGELRITFGSLAPPTFTFSWGNLPGWIDWILGPLLSGLGDALGAALAALLDVALHGVTFPVMSVPSVKVALGGTSYRLSIAQASTSAGDGPQGPLLLVTGEPSFTAAGPSARTGPRRQAPPRLAPGGMTISMSRRGERLGDVLQATVGEVYEITALVDGEQAVDCQWTVPTQAVVQDYQPTATSAGRVPVGPADLAANPITLAFWRPGAYEISVTGFAPDGTPASGQDEVECGAPIASLVAEYLGAVRAGPGDDGAQWLQLAGPAGQLGHGQVGIKLVGDVTDAPVAGSVACIQLATPARYGVRAGQPVAWSLNGQTVLDGGPTGYLYQDTVVAIAQGGEATIEVTDCPALYATPDMGWNEMSISRGGPAETFQTFLMYQPVGGIWVPLEVITWTWQGHTVQTGDAWSPVQGPGQSCGEGIGADDFPSWTAATAGGSYAPGSRRSGR
jgi:hypothetical protein